MRKLLSMVIVAALLALTVVGLKEAIGASGTLMSTQTSDAVAITGGTIDGVTLGPSTAITAAAINSLVASNVSATNLTASSTVTGAQITSSGTITGGGGVFSGQLTSAGLSVTGLSTLSALDGGNTLIKAGGAAPTLRPMGVIFSTNARTSTGTGTGEQDLVSWSLPASALNRIGARLRIKANFSAAANGNNKTFKCYFGSTSISSGVLTPNTKQASCEINVVRTGSNTQIMWSNMLVDTTWITGQFASTGETDTAAITIKATGTDGTSSAGDIVLNDMYVEYMN